MKMRFLSLENWMNRAALLQVLSQIPAVLVCFTLLPVVNAELPPPPPGGDYPNMNTAVGTGALLDLTTGQDNTALGFRVLTENTEGNLNTAVGSTALRNNRGGNRNTATGDASLFDNSAGNNNTANGYRALQSNKGNNQTAIGAGALEDTATSSNNTALGYQAGKNLTTGNDNIDVGNPGVAGESGAIRIGSSDQTRTFIAGIHGAVLTGGGAVIVNNLGQLGRAASSERFKEEIKPMGKESEAILTLRPVTFRYKKEIDPQNMLQFGLVAEEVEKVNPDLVVRDKHGKTYSVRYEAVNAMLLNEFLKQHRRVATVASCVEQLRTHVNEQNAQIDKMSEEFEMSESSAGPILRAGPALQVVSHR
jgi:hypothetical protein